MTQQRWVDLQRWVDDGQVRPLPSTPEAIAGALRQVAGDWSVELIVEVGGPRLRDRSPGNPKLIVSACEGRLAVPALDIGAERATYYLVGDHAGVVTGDASRGPGTRVVIVSGREGAHGQEWSWTPNSRTGSGQAAPDPGAPESQHRGPGTPR
jgi:hypothetical protein